MIKGVYFKVKTPLGVVVRTTKDYWEEVVSTKHPSIAKHKNKVKNTLKDPDEIRRSEQDPSVHLHYMSIGKLSICVVADYQDDKEGYLITTYLTDRIKEGGQVYVKDKNIL